MKVIFQSDIRNRCRSISLGPLAVASTMLFVLVTSCVLFYSGYNYAVGRSARTLTSIREQTSSAWEKEINAQESALNDLQQTAEKSLDTMAGRLSLLQGNVMRLDALGARLAAMAKLDDLEFGVDNPPGMGGPIAEGPQQSINIPDFLRTLEQLEVKIQDRSEKLSAIETMLINRSLQEQTQPDGHPATGGWLSSVYGYRSHPISGKREMHEGLDFAGKPGTPIAAVAAGIVTWSGPRYDYGNLVEIDHGSGYITRYAHNEKNLVAVGDKVEKGEVIAIMGNSGRSTGTHVHFEVLRDGIHVNPNKYISLK